MINSYIKQHHKKNIESHERDNYFFGMCFGFILLLLNLFLFLSNPENVFFDKVNIVLIFLGCLLIMLATIYPNTLAYLRLFIKKIFSLIGSFIFKIVLFVLYYILVIPIGFILKKRNEKKQVISETNFNIYKKENFYNKRKGVYNILQIFRIFTNEKYFLMLPLIVIFILFGFLLIFVQSSIVAPFIYTLF